MWRAALCHAGLCPLECSRPCCQGPSLLQLTACWGLGALPAGRRRASGSRDACAWRGGGRFKPEHAAWAAFASCGATGGHLCSQRRGRVRLGPAREDRQRFGVCGQQLASWTSGPVGHRVRSGKLHPGLLKPASGCRGGQHSLGGLAQQLQGAAHARLILLCSRAGQWRDEVPRVGAAAGGLRCGVCV